MLKIPDIIERFHSWRARHISTKTFIILLSIAVGILSGFIAVIIKNAVKLAYRLLNVFTIDSLHNYLLFIYPIIGITITVLFIKFVLRKPVRPGIPNVLYSISKRKGFISFHNTFSSVITSALTVGFGGSVGLEGPTVSTGTAIASQMSKFFRLEYKYIILMLACACAGSMAAIFKAPIAAIVFAVEVIMIDLTTFSLIPLLLASAAAVVTSYLFLGMDVLYPFEVKTAFDVGDLPFYIALGFVAGLVSVYFTNIYNYLAKFFTRYKTRVAKLAVGGSMLGFLLILFPSLYGEGYEAINSGLAGNLSYLFDRSFFQQFSDNIWVVMALLLCVVMFKVVATSATFGAGGVGGIFAPTLFIGVNTGLLFAILVNEIFGFAISVNNFALIGMAGLIAGVLHAPL
nr:chloride channel protein [Prolixibacteraceae bacterium]